MHLRAFALAAGLVAACVGSTAKAQSAGDAPSALPGIVRVGVPEIGGRRVAAALSLGYGFTEALKPTDGVHHRVIGILAASATPLDWLSVGLRSDARYDRHPGGDDGFIANPALAARVGHRLGERFDLGLEAGITLFGTESVSTTFGSASPQAVLEAAFATGGFTIAAQGGYRLDRSSEAGRRAARYSFGDRISLGLSDFDSVIAGLGLGYRLANTELLAEASGDVLVGNAAPPLSQSPLRASVGVRQHLSPTVQTSLIAETSLSSRPAVGPTDPLVPIEPRVSVLAGLGVVFDLAGAAPATVVAPPLAPVRRAAPTSTRLTLTITDPHGKPIAGASASVKTATLTSEQRSDSDGKAVFDRVPGGRASIAVQSQGFEPFTRDVPIDPARPANLDVQLVAKPQGQVRGIIRAFSGAGVQASVKLEPVGVESKADAQGYFEINVPPGRYDVVIEAPGYRTQRTSVEVQKDGVVVLNADLFKE